MDIHCYGYTLLWIYIVMDIHCYGYTLLWIYIVMDIHCYGYLRYYIKVFVNVTKLTKKNEQNYQWYTHIEYITSVYHL